MASASGASTSLLDRWLRPGANTRRDVIVDLLWLIGLALLLMATGLGLREDLSSGGTGRVGVGLYWQRAAPETFVSATVVAGSG